MGEAQSTRSETSATDEQTSSQGQPGLWGATNQVFNAFFEDHAMTFAAALAYYTALSLAPLLTLLAWITRFFTSGARDQIVRQAENFLGTQAAQPIRQVLDNADSPSMTVAGLVSLGILAFSAAGVFAQLQTAMNTIWNIRPLPGQGVKPWLRKRVLSLGMVLTIAFLLLVSMVVSATLEAMMQTATQWLPGGAIVWQVVNVVVSIAVLILLFAVMFQYLPDVKIEWRNVWVGAIVTAILFTLGKYLIGLYLSQSSYNSSYGAAIGSFIALLVWVYYSSVILFLGAEITQVYARRHGDGVQPNKHAMRVVTIKRPATA